MRPFYIKKKTPFNYKVDHFERKKSSKLGIGNILVYLYLRSCKRYKKCFYILKQDLDSQFRKMKNYKILYLPNKCQNLSPF